MHTAFANSYPVRRDRLAQQMQSTANAAVRLKKDTSNLFRDRVDGQNQELSVRDFNHLLEIDIENQTLVSEGMNPYGELVDATLQYGFMPLVVPQLNTITIGGAVAGIGIESTSFKYGLPHETVIEMEVLLADGSIVNCTSTNEHADLYFGLPNSYGTLGYVLKLKTPALPVKRFVKLNHKLYRDAEELFDVIAALRNSDIDFLDGSVFGQNEYYLTIGQFTDTAPFTSDYTYLDIYYKSIPEKQFDYLTVKDYIWRWDTDWFWCSKNLYVQNGFMRRLVGKKKLNSRTYTKVMRWNSKWGVTKFLNRMGGYHPESVIQDVDIPIENAAEFLDFLLREIGVLPIWICPVGTSDKSDKFPLFPMKPDSTYINFGFWDSVKSRQKNPPGYLNRKIERKTADLGGIKSLYSDAYFEEDEFWTIYRSESYWALKERYDPNGKFLSLYEKSVLRK